MEKILAEAIAALVSGRTVALSTILSGSGSLPMSRRSKMLVLPDGTLRGTVGGGCLEAEVYASAKEVLGGESSPRIRRFVLTESEAGAEGLNCGGTVEILTEAVTPGSVVAVLEACLGMLERREDAVLATRLDAPGAEGPGKLLLGAGGRVAG
ncbi:MAG TPA: XdhC family protein, partial [Candidatus Saccharimonadales bacterium]|nr:XdhC family protein [Candidatus Saccharimonadales bacterium]